MVSPQRSLKAKALAKKGGSLHGRKKRWEKITRGRVLAGGRVERGVLKKKGEKKVNGSGKLGAFKNL